MALEYKPLPELTGENAIYFWKTVENFKISETPEEIREINRYMREASEKAEKRLRKEL